MVDDRGRRERFPRPRGEPVRYEPVPPRRDWLWWLCVVVLVCGLVWVAFWALVAWGFAHSNWQF